MSADLLRTLALAGPALLLSLSVHEYAHAWMATRLGDDTPRLQGRLTLNPMSHIDLFGTIIVPALMLATTSGFFGWAKPVEFNPANFRRTISMRRGAMLTAAAGPMANVLLAFLTLLALRLVHDTGALDALPLGQREMLLRFATLLFSLNVLLAVFNLLPLPPLDGSYLLPRSLDGLRSWLTRYSLLVFLFLFFLPFPGLGYPLGSAVIHPLVTALERLLTTVATASL